MIQNDIDRRSKFSAKKLTASWTWNLTTYGYFLNGTTQKKKPYKIKPKTNKRSLKMFRCP